MSYVEKSKVLSVLIALSLISSIVGIVLLEGIVLVAGWICVGIGALLFLVSFIWILIATRKRRVILNNNRIKAVIFDMDGTLIDSTSLWHEIDKEFFRKRGMEIPSDYAQKIVHLGLTEAAKFTKSNYGIKESEQEIIDEWHQMSIDMYANDVQLKEGVLELLEFFRKKNIPMAIATANDDKLYMPCLKRLDILQYFAFVADVNSVKEGKQSAKIYENLASQMKTQKENTLVVEDMPTCVKTAHSAGFITVAVFDNASKEFDEDKKTNSDLYINNFYELTKLLKGE